MTGSEDALVVVVADGLEGVKEASGEAEFLAEEPYGSSGIATGVIARGYFMEFVLVDGTLCHSLR